MGCRYTVSRPMDIEDLLAIIRGHWRVPSCRENGLHRVLNMQFREDRLPPAQGSCPRRHGHPAAALNMVRTLQHNFKPDLSIGLLRDKIGRNPALLALILA